MAKSEGVGKGATFSVTFPLLADRGELANLPHSRELISAGVRSLGGLRVLLVDDEREARLVIARVIARAGAEVTTCMSASEGLAKLVEWRPDVVLSDIAMPEEDGYSFINKVRSLTNEKGGETPAAALTAYAREEDRARALAAGYQMHISKPIDANHLVNMVARLAGRCTQPPAGI